MPRFFHHPQIYELIQLIPENVVDHWQKEVKTKMRSVIFNLLLILFFVPKTGLEPAHLAAPPPEDGASTNFATWAAVALS